MNTLDKLTNYIFLGFQSDRISFTAIHKGSVKFKSFQRNVFVPGVDINVTITDNERNLTSHFLNPNL